MLKKIIILTAIIFLLTCITTAKTQNFLLNNKLNKNLISPIRLIPGIEQIQNKKYLKGTLFITGFIASITGALINNHSGYSFYNRYLESNNIQNITFLRKNSEAAFRRRNIFLAGAFSIWMFHLIDLKIFKKGGRIKSEISLAIDNFGWNIYF
jgi:hypothetical protein